MCTIAAQTPPAIHGKGLRRNGPDAISALSSANCAASSIAGMASAFREKDREVVFGFHDYS